MNIITPEMCVSTTVSQPEYHRVKVVTSYKGAVILDSIVYLRGMATLTYISQHDVDSIPIDILVAATLNHQSEIKRAESKYHLTRYSDTLILPAFILEALQTYIQLNKKIVAIKFLRGYLSHHHPLEDNSLTTAKNYVDRLATYMPKD